MKKKLPSLFAIILGIGLSAFTAQKQKNMESGVYWFAYRYDPTGWDFNFLKFLPTSYTLMGHSQPCSDQGMFCGIAADMGTWGLPEIEWFSDIYIFLLSYQNGDGPISGLIAETME